MGQLEAQPFEFFIYLFLKRSWSDADSFCKSNQMKLVSIETETEQDLIYSELVRNGLFCRSLLSNFDASNEIYIFFYKR